MVYKRQPMSEPMREQLGFESIPENNESLSWCDDVWQTVPETSSDHQKGTVADFDIRVIYIIWISTIGIRLLKVENNGHLSCLQNTAVLIFYKWDVHLK